MNRFEKLSVEDILQCYRQWDEMQHHTGVCTGGLLREIMDKYDADERDGRPPVKAVNEDLLEEIARRWALEKRQLDSI